MLDERDLQAIAQLIDTRLDQRLTQQKTELMQEIGQQKTELMQEIGRQKTEIMQEVGALMEAYFEPKFNLLADGQKLIWEKLVPAEAQAETEERLDVLEAVVKRHSREIETLKKAQ